MGIESYSTTPADNNSPSPNGWPEGMAPSDVNNSARQNMADLRTWYETAEWIDLGNTPTYASATTFTISGDVTTAYHVGRRLRLEDVGTYTYYATITASSYSAPNTTITISLDSGSIDANLDRVSLGIISRTNSSFELADDSVTTAKINDSAVTTAKINDDAVTLDKIDAIITALFKNYNNITISNHTDTDHDILFSAGTARDSGNAYNLTLASAMVKRIDATWAAGTGNGGLFSGSVGNNTTYHCFLIRKDSDGTIDAGFDTSLTAANIPSGYTAYRRVGSIVTDGSANIRNFTQYGNRFIMRDHAVMNGGAVTDPGTTAQTITLDNIPTGLQVQALVNGYVVANTSTLIYMLVTSVDQVNAVPSSTLFSTRAQNANSRVGACNLAVTTNTSAQIRYRLDASGASDSVVFNSYGWIDYQISQGT